MRTYMLDDYNFSIIGRGFRDKDGTLWCVQSGSGAEFGFSGKKLVLTVKGGATAFPKDENSVRMVVFVNGERKLDTVLDENEQSFVLIESEHPVSAEIRIVKASEAAKSVMGIVSVSADDTAELSPVKEKAIKIEFIGDSITCGYGVDDEVIEHSFSTSTEDCTKAFAYKTARALGAQYSMFSYSGWGVVSGWTEDGTRALDKLIAPYYESVGFCEAAPGDIRVQDIGWDFGAYQPDIVVINLGTNDESYCGMDEVRREEFVKEYVKFLSLIRSHNSEALILCTLGIMGDALFPCVERACKEYRALTGDKNVSALRFVPQDGELDGYAVNWHPTEKTHDKASDALTKFIRRYLYIKTERMKEMETKKYIALTFDDGPDPTNTTSVLDTLEKYGARASFFLIGENISEETKPLVRRALSLGCEIENHSLTHPYMNKMSESQIRHEVDETDRLISEITGEVPTYFRPPFIEVSDLMYQTIDKFFICGIGSNDWMPETTAEQITEGVLSQAVDGAMMLLHDGKFNAPTAEAVKTIVPELQKRGFELVTLEELFKAGSREHLKGILYSHTDPVSPLNDHD